MTNPPRTSPSSGDTKEDIITNGHDIKRPSLTKWQQGSNILCPVGEIILNDSVTVAGAMLGECMQLEGPTYNVTITIPWWWSIQSEYEIVT